MMKFRIPTVLLICFILWLASSTAFAQAYGESELKLCIQYSGEKALPHCERAVAGCPCTAPDEEQAQVYFYMGTTLGELGRYEEAMHYLKKASKLDSDNPKIWYNIGVTYAALNRHTKALYAYRKATNLDESMVDAWGNRGVEAYETERYFEAVTSFECAMKIDPSYLDTRPEQREMYDEAAGTRPKSVQMRREVDISFSPGIGYIYPIGSDFKPKALDYILLDTEVDVQIYGGWFATASFLYSHTSWQSSSQGGGIDIYAPTFGFKYKRMSPDLKPHESRIFLDKSRFWFGLSVGPYFTNASAAASPVGGPFSLGMNSVDIGFNGNAGFDYFFYPNVGVGFQAKFHFVNFADSYVIFSGGPRIVVRF